MSLFRPTLRLALVLPTILAAGVLALGGSALVGPPGAGIGDDVGDDAAIELTRTAHELLAERCHACHGPVRAKGGLRLDRRDAALAGSHLGRDTVLVPGDPAASRILARVRHVDPDERMPPEGEPLTAEEVALLRDWIVAGAAWPAPADGDADAALASGVASDADTEWRHWAYVPPVRAAFDDDGAAPHAPRNPIDALTQHERVAAGLAPAPPADLAVLARRVSLDLTGLPPTPERVDALAAAASGDSGSDSGDVGDPDPYERYVDELLASPHFGERWAAMWLDLARYADTRGYESDGARSIWRWRDWVVDAFNSNKRFDEFTIEQLAGDLLAAPSNAQLLATAFHRNTMANDEGGTDDEEFRVAAVVDRVDTTFEVWTGTTLACARCHDHKFDPFDTRDYFGAYAFFNQTEDADRPDEAPTLVTPTPDQARRIGELSQRLATAESRLLADEPRLDPYEAAWIARAERELRSAERMHLRFRPWYRSGPFKPPTLELGVLSAFDTVFPPEEEIDIAARDPDGGRVWTRRDDYADGVVYDDFSGRGVAFYLTREFDVAEPGTVQLRLGSDDAVKLWLDGTLVHANMIYRGAALDQDQVSVELAPGRHELLLKIVNGGGPAGFAFRAVTLDLPADVLAALAVPETERDDDMRASLRAAHREFAHLLAPVRAERDALREELLAIDAPRTPILRELADASRRTTSIHLGGDFLSPGEVLDADVPAVFPQLAEGAPRNRLGLARWLVDPAHPLTARVFVNRVWAEIFGLGLVTTPEDFGTQGEPPSNPTLLDHLAVEFVESGWDVKALLRLIVTSSTYRQGSAVDPEALALDAENRHVLRGPRFRLSAETVRDQALAVSGLLVPTLGGPPVMPPQPAGLWQVVYNDSDWMDATDADRWRRGIYTFWRRTSPYPSMTTFDAPSREICVSRRIRTNTPLQALVTLNDPVFVEASQALARRMLTEAGPDAGERARRGFRLCLLREPEPDEWLPLVGLYERTLEHLADRPEQAAALAGFTDGKSLLGPLPTGASMQQLAAWTVVANVLLNLDEFLVKA